MKAIKGLEIRLIIDWSEKISDNVIDVSIVKEYIWRYYQAFDTIIPNGTHIIIKDYEPFVVVCHEVDFENGTLTFIVE